MFSKVSRENNSRYFFHNLYYVLKPSYRTRCVSRWQFRPWGDFASLSYWELVQDMLFPHQGWIRPKNVWPLHFWKLPPWVTQIAYINPWSPLKVITDPHFAPHIRTQLSSAHPFSRCLYWPTEEPLHITKCQSCQCLCWSCLRLQCVWFMHRRGLRFVGEISYVWLSPPAVAPA